MQAWLFDFIGFNGQWFIVNFVKIRQIVFLTGIVFLLVWVIGSFASGKAAMLLTNSSYTPFAYTLPLRLTFAVSAWIAFMIQTVYAEKREETAFHEETSERETLPKITAEEYLDRISVKDGTRIHIIMPEELLYIQACGDYVTLFTSAGQYVKEQTMKYFETHLPPASFIRIHRSTIVNVAQISRVEYSAKKTINSR